MTGELAYRSYVYYIYWTLGHLWTWAQIKIVPDLGPCSVTGWCPPGCWAQARGCWDLLVWSWFCWRSGSYLPHRIRSSGVFKWWDPTLCRWYPLIMHRQSIFKLRQSLLGPAFRDSASQLRLRGRRAHHGGCDREHRGGPCHQQNQTEVLHHLGVDGANNRFTTTMTSSFICTIHIPLE